LPDHQITRSSPASRIRWRIAGLLFLISVVTYIDRVNISITARQMMPAWGLTEIEMGQVFSAFVVGYALCQIPGGWFGDRWGARAVLTAAILWWSAFTALTAVAATWPLASLVGVLTSLIIVRFLVGVGEAAALPNFNRTVANWLPAQERGLGIGLAIGGIGIGSALTPPITAWVMVNFGWQTAFYGSAALGVLVAAAWWLYARDRPDQHPHVNAAELAAIGTAERAEEPPPWRRLLGNPAVRWLVLSYTCLGYVAYVFMSWFYLYLVNVRGFGVLRGALFASAPFIAMAVSCPLGGWATDRLARQHGLTRGRAYAGAAGMLLAAACILLGAVTAWPSLAIALLSLGAGWLYFAVGAYWATTIDVSPRHAGALSGLMNTGANIGGSLSPTLTPLIAQHWGWTAALGAAAAIALAGGVMWAFIDPGRRSASSPPCP
jgi:ACS family glucarate transporter-like MFS transporter